jgi:hypothetical protein
MWQSKLAALGQSGLPASQQTKLTARYTRYITNLQTGARPDPYQTQSEMAYIQSAAGGKPETAYKFGRPDPRTKGSTAPDYVQSSTLVEYKNYRLDSKGETALVREVTRQVTARREHGPYDIRQQAVIVDARGQQLKPGQAAALRARLVTATGLPPENIEIVAWEPVSTPATPSAAPAAPITPGPANAASTTPAVDAPPAQPVTTTKPAAPSGTGAEPVPAESALKPGLKSGAESAAAESALTGGLESGAGSTALKAALKDGLKSGIKAIGWMILFAGLMYLIDKEQAEELEINIEKAKRAFRKSALRLKAEHPELPVYLTVVVRSERYERYIAPGIGWVPQTPILGIWKAELSRTPIDPPTVEVEDNRLVILRPGMVTTITYSELLEP